MAFYFLLFLAGAKGQDPDYRADTSALTRILVHFDKAVYFPGDTLFFKAYIYADYSLNLISKNLYAGLFSDSGQLLLSYRFPVMGGTCQGNMELPASLPHGIYYFQAFTPQQLNAGDSMVCLKQVYLLNPASLPSRYASAPAPEYSIGFYPQGGNLVEGLSNKIVFKATDRFGNPVPVNGWITENGTDSLLPFSGEKGTGSFYFLPERKRYTVIVSYAGQPPVRTQLPGVQAEGMTLIVSGNNSAKTFLAESSYPDEEKNMELLGVMNDRICFRQALRFRQHSCPGVIPVSQLPSGLLHLAVKDAEGKILAQAVTFINNREYREPVSLKTDSLDFNPGGKNLFTIVFPDTLTASLSVSVTDTRQTRIIQDLRPPTLISEALILGERKEPVLFPFDPETDTTRSGQEQIEEWVQSGPWRQPDWVALVGNRTGGRLYDSSYIVITGKLLKEGKNVSVGGGRMNLMMSTVDSLVSFMQAEISQDGYFGIQNLVFEDTASFSYGMNKGKGGPVEAVIGAPADYSFAMRFRGKPDRETGFDKMVLADPVIRKSVEDQVNGLNDSSGKYKILSEAIIKVRKRNPTQLVNQRYSTGLLSNMTQARVLDFINEPPTGGAPNIFEYLKGRLAGVMISRVRGTYILESFRGLSISNMTMGGNGLIDGVFYLNDREATSDELSFIPLDRIALVKYFPPGTLLLMGVGTAPVLAVYTKEGDDLRTMASSHLNVFRYPGYSRTWLQPDESDNMIYSGNRGTIYWQPDLFLDGESNSCRFRFINTTGAKEFRILIQGVTTDGKFIFREMVISPEQKGF